MAGGWWLVAGGWWLVGLLGRADMHMAEKLRTVEELDAWKFAMEVVTLVNAVSRDWPT